MNQARSAAHTGCAMLQVESILASSCCRGLRCWRNYVVTSECGRQMRPVRCFQYLEMGHLTYVLHGWRDIYAEEWQRRRALLFRPVCGCRHIPLDFDAVWPRALTELISFMFPESHYLPSSPSHDMRHNHPWANKANGWLAYAFPSVSYATPPLSTILSVLLQAAGSETHYELEVPKVHSVG